nr:ribonuclease H-like domain, reverse transcriptase, RNA-dependent DNA polymerase [Tanacetum cinerariifolium]
MSTVQKSKFGESAFISYVHNQNRTNHADHLHCLFACFLSQLEPSSVEKALADPDWVAAMQEKMQQFYNQQVWKLVPLPTGKIAIRSKWILKNKRDAEVLWYEIKPDWWLKVIGKRRALIMMRRGAIDKTLFLKKDSRHIILIQVYVDDIIFGSTNKAWCDEFEVLMKGEFEMSAM